jgi:hypothetical protein
MVRCLGTCLHNRWWPGRLRRGGCEGEGDFSSVDDRVRQCVRGDGIFPTDASISSMIGELPGCYWACW